MVGYIIFNEHQVKYDDGNFKVQVDTFVHEILHCLYFHPLLFEHFPDDRFGKPFMSEDENENYFLTGNNIRKATRNHFNCSKVKGGNLQILNYGI